MSDAVLRACGMVVNVGGITGVRGMDYSLYEAINIIRFDSRALNPRYRRGV